MGIRLAGRFRIWLSRTFADEQCEWLRADSCVGWTAVPREDVGFLVFLFVLCRHFGSSCPRTVICQLAPTRHPHIPFRNFCVP